MFLPSDVYNAPAINNGKYTWGRQILKKIREHKLYF